MPRRIDVEIQSVQHGEQHHSREHYQTIDMTMVAIAEADYAQIPRNHRELELQIPRNWPKRSRTSRAK
jgi:hypothetical protein